MRRLVLPAMVMLALSGCGGGLLAPSDPPPALYTLQGPASVAASGGRANWQLLVDEPGAALDLNIVRIAVAPTQSRIDYYSGVAWADRPPAMIQDLLVQSFAISGRIDAVERRSGGVRGDFILATDLLDFQAEADHSTPVAHVTLIAHLVRTRDRTIVATRIFEANMPANGGIDDVVAAFNNSLQAMLPQIVAWTLDEGDRNR
jgi:cholesterol transport system auxiliary component